MLYNAQLDKMLSDITDNINDELATIGMTDLESKLYDIDREYQDNIEQINAIEDAKSVAESQLDVISSMSDMVENYLMDIQTILTSLDFLSTEDVDDIIANIFRAHT